MILPVKFPPITSDPQYADLLAATLPYKGGYEWYISNFIQIYTDFLFYKQYGKGELRFREHLFILNRPTPSFWYDCIPFVKTKNYIHDVSLFIDVRNITEYFKHIINEGNYIIAYVDRHYANARYPLGTLHSMLIYGYDSYSFKVADFISNSGTYTFSEVSIDNIHKSFNPGNEYDLPPFIDSANKVVYFAMSDAEYKMDTGLIKRLLEDYYLERNTTDSYECLEETNKHEHNAIWGMGCISYVIDYLSNLEEKTLDLKALVLLSDHKKAMVERLEYLLSIGQLTDSSAIENYVAIRDKMQSCVGLGVKYLLTNEKKFVSQIVHQLQTVYESEKNVLPKILNDIG